MKKDADAIAAAENSASAARIANDSQSNALGDDGMRSWSGIRFLVCALFALCAAGGFGASVMRQSSLPASGFSDTEAVTNVVFSFAEDVARDFSVRLELDATPSNCVEVAFGCDADGDGRLGTAEAELALGWDCGRWFVVGTNRLARIEAEPSVTVASEVIQPEK